ncbi:hypothetical protein GPECTOR_47g308 [Gonium pectorale]|uniref:DUF7906 domain-containing protein n=1 Tax=Gonium pectorale TaxID=33097 RepID=A0A150G8D9_GONPE|nr:hypothetical protein GPECTOR_47g308 [Gonium pectorale]|eukprot:KXZ46033.1 hypothetical protein GPECTOR_47g308 [Gonium pectorale]
MARCRGLLCSLLLAAIVFHECVAKAPLPGSGSKRELKRSSAKRWEAIHEVVRAEIKSATKHFLEERARALVLPLEVDLLFIGFDGDGGYGYKLDRQALEELLGSATEDNTICPTVWETGEHAAVCFSINYILLDSTKSNKAIERIEEALKSNMEFVGDRSQDWPDGSRDVAVFEVEANGEVEATVWDLLDESYGSNQPEASRSQHSQIVIINPSKRRLAAGLPEPPGWGGTDRGHMPAGAAGSHDEAVRAYQQSRRWANAHAAGGPDVDFIAEWKKGTVSAATVVEQEAGFLYRYRYQGRGGAAAVVSQYNFLLIDIAAGPVSYGPLASPAGSVTPTAMPRLMPMLLKMTTELERNTEFGTYRTHLLEEAARGASALFVGQLASTVAAASRHLFATDLRLAGAEALAGGPGGAAVPRRVVVPIILLQDHTRYLEEEEHDGTPRYVDTELVQLALDELLPPEVAAAVSLSRHMLHHHRTIAAALVKARHTRSEAVLITPPDTGLHRSLSVSLDSSLLLSELVAAAGTPESGGPLLGGMEEHIAEDYVGRLPYMDDAAEFLEEKRHTTKILPVFVFSLQRSPDQMLFDNRQLVAASPGAVAVLQLLGGPDHADPSRGRVYSGHMAEGHHLLMDAGEAPTRSIIAGLAAALGGLVPPHQRHCGAEGGLVEDWRWAVGAVPWGPYSNYTGPFAYLSRAASHGSGSDNRFGEERPQHRLLDLLARQHVRYHNASKSTFRSLLGGGGAAKPGAKQPPQAPSPSPPSHSPSPDPPHHHHDTEDASPPDDGGEDGGGFVHDYPGGVSTSDSGSASHGGAKHQEHAEDVVAEQEALSPDVAARLQLRIASFMLYD